MVSNVDQQIVDYFDSYNIDRIVDYHNEIKRLFQNEICYINRKLDDETVVKSLSDNLLVRKGRYENGFYPQMIITNFLMMFSYLEEFLYLVNGRSKNKLEVENTEGSGSIGRFKEVVKDINPQILKLQIWQFFINAEKVRNCLLHANGRIDILNTPNKIKNLENIINSSKKLLKLDKSRLMLSSDYISKFSENIKSFYQLIK
jgi:hypothetical protein